MPRQSKPSGAAAPSQGSRFYPNANQLKDAAGVQQQFRVLLDKFYDLSDRHAELQKTVAAGDATMAPASAPASASKFPPGSGPSDSQLLGLNVEPVDVNSLADGATLQFSKANGTFKFT